MADVSGFMACPSSWYWWSALQAGSLSSRSGNLGSCLSDCHGDVFAPGFLIDGGLHDCNARRHIRGELKQPKLVIVAKGAKDAVAPA